MSDLDSGVTTRGPEVRRTLKPINVSAQELEATKTALNMLNSYRALISRHHYARIGYCLLSVCRFPSHRRQCVAILLQTENHNDVSVIHYLTGQT